MKNQKTSPKQKIPLVSIAITNWNGKDYCLDCLQSISVLNYPRELLDVIVVDNASTDGSVGAVKKRFPWVHVLAQKANLGFSAGMNVGIKNAKGKYVLVLNNDVKLEKNCLKEMVKLADEDTHIAVVGGEICSIENPKEIQSLWGQIDRKTMQIYLTGRGEINRGQYQEIVEADYVPFLCLIRKKVLEKVGDLDERYFSTFEDTDLMVRIKDAGYKIVFCPKATIWHKGAAAFGSDSPKLIYYLQRNNLLIRSKFNGFTWIDHLKNFRFFITLFISAVFARERRAHQWAALRGIIDFYRGHFGQAPEPC